jgi:hypothetical protein
MNAVVRGIRVLARGFRQSVHGLPPITSSASTKYLFSEISELFSAPSGRRPASIVP